MGHMDFFTSRARSRLILLFLCVILPGCATTRHPYGYKVDGAEIHTFRDLSDEQAAEILPILEKRFAGLRDSIRREHEAIAGDIDPVLTPEQRAIHKRMIEEKRERFLGKGERKATPE